MYSSFVAPQSIGLSRLTSYKPQLVSPGKEKIVLLLSVIVLCAITLIEFSPQFHHRHLPTYKMSQFNFQTNGFLIFY